MRNTSPPILKCFMVFLIFSVLLIHRTFFLTRPKFHPDQHIITYLPSDIQHWILFRKRGWVYWFRFSEKNRNDKLVWKHPSQKFWIILCLQYKPFMQSITFFRIGKNFRRSSADKLHIFNRNCNWCRSNVQE